ncbi:MAG: acyltransferase family protein, partial [Aeromicrobium sp.]
MSSKVRAEIQGLRALAVGLVILYHLWPLHLPGGYIGVDVFFVISGFLITSHLVREVESSGRISLPQFWARRARRLLPASLLVAAVSAVGVLVLVPKTLWVQFLREVFASVLYVQNWALARDSVDYLAADNVVSPVQHFWSLSVEEQFYLVWPLLILLAVALSRRRSNRWKRVAIAVTLGAVVAVSLAYSVWETFKTPQSAYFVTPTRAWEFGVGGLLAVLGTATRSEWNPARSAVSWIGIGAIAISALTFTDQTPFPGWAAMIPVCGALAIIWAGETSGWWSSTWIARSVPVRFIGDTSYSSYLWHWPLIVLVPYATNSQLTTGQKLLILLATLLLAQASKTLVEDPTRIAKFFAAARPRRTFAFSVLGMVAVLTISGCGLVALQMNVAAQKDAARSVLSNPPSCFGASAMDDGLVCDNPKLGGMIVPSPLYVDPDASSKCTRLDSDPSGLSPCEFGTPQEDAAARVVLIGDSHAIHMRDALLQTIKDRHWNAISLAKSGCPASLAVKIIAEPD